MNISHATFAQVNNLYRQWLKNTENQRFGQYIVNKLGWGTCPALFYETNPNKAFDMACDEMEKRGSTNAH